MAEHLLIEVRLHDGRYHGAGDWPPSPARLFQALVAGAGLGRNIPESEADAFQWLESLPPPRILAPPATETRGYTNYVPNNDLDAKKGDPRNISAIRTGKTIRARVFDAASPICYIWELPAEAVEKANIIVKIASRLYQLGRGVDMAWANASVLEDEALNERHQEFALERFSPGAGADGVLLQTPCAGSYRSLRLRYEAGGRRFSISKNGKSVSRVLAQAPKPRFRTVAYNSPPAIHLFDLRLDSENSPFFAVPLVAAASLTTAVRDAAFARLSAANLAEPSVVERSLVGKNPDGSHGGTAGGRIRIIPLPSIGHQHADMAIRRVAISIPPGCALAKEDILWAFSGLKLTFSDQPLITLESADKKMLRSYLAPEGAKVWRSITPVALPESAARRRIDPARKTAEAKPATERANEESRAAAAVIQALRHAGFENFNATVTRLSRTPLHLQGARADLFAPGSRFAKERLWHVEVHFPQRVKGPVIIGDGRFYGLGLLAPNDH